MTEKDKIPVIEEAEVLSDAYHSGYKMHEDSDDPAAGEVHEVVEAVKGTALWANTIAPQLRAMAGYHDTGYGTFTTEREVALIPEGDGDDRPAEAVEMGGVHVYEALVDAFDVGALDALEGRDPDATRAERI